MLTHALCVCVRACVCVRTGVTRRGMCVYKCVSLSRFKPHTNPFNQPGAWTNDGGPRPLPSALTPKKQARRASEAVGRPRPSSHSPLRPCCLFSEALEETLDGAYQIQTVTLLCYSTHKSPLSPVLPNCFPFCTAE